MIPNGGGLLNHMEPLIVLIGVTMVILVAGAAGVKRLRPWPVALRGGVAAMFMLTGTVHFVWMRKELISMVPPFLPNPGFIVTLTGLLEWAGAIGVLAADCTLGRWGTLASAAYHVPCKYSLRPLRPRDQTGRCNISTHSDANRLPVREPYYHDLLFLPTISTAAKPQ